MPKKVLIIDSDQKVRESVESFLTKAGYDTASVWGVLPALRLFENQSGIGTIDAVVMTIQDLGAEIFLLHYLYNVFGPGARPTSLVFYTDETVVLGEQTIHVPDFLKALFPETEVSILGDEKNRLAKIADFVR